MRTFLLAAALTLGAVAASFTAFAAPALDKVEFADTGLPPPSGTLVVPDQFTTIQAAIDAAGDGDTVLVRPGTYPGGLLISGKRVTLESEYQSTSDLARIDSTVISGGSPILNIEVSAVGVVIDGFTFTEGRYAVVAHGNRTIVRNNRFIDNGADSMSFENTGGYVVGNTFLNSRDDCIDVDDPKNVFIENNICISPGDDGVEIRNFDYTGPDTLTTTISGNTIVGAREDGVQIIDYAATSNRVFRLERNEIRNSVGAGLGIMGDGQTREDYSGYSMPERIYVLNNTFDGNSYAITGGDNLIALNNSFTHSTVLALKNVDGNSVVRYSLFHGNAADQESSNVITSNDISAAPRLVAVAPIGVHGQAPIQLVPIVSSGLVAPLFLTTAGDRSGRLFIVEQEGRIRVWSGGTLRPRPFLDLADRVLAGGERGLLGLAFHPQFNANGRFFVDYTRKPDGATVVSEFHAGNRANVADPAERKLLTVAQPFANHNGGMLAFGPGGSLFIGMGDGGSEGDPQNRAQNPNVLLGKILRIDVNRGQPYAIPAANPFARGGGRAEIFALGFRNPWRFSFDRLTGQLYVGDVGQAAVEEIDVVGRGLNYGWRIMEGDRCFNRAAGCFGPDLKLPVATYTQTNGRCAVTGGYVYRGRAIPALFGTYIYGDFCSGEIFGLLGVESRVLLDTDLNISSFGENRAGELYVVDLQGTIHAIKPPPS